MNTPPIGFDTRSAAPRGSCALCTVPARFVEYFMCDMPDTVRALIDEQELKSLLPMTLRQIRTLRLAGQIPYLKVNRRTFLYNPERVLSALKKLETKSKKSRAATTK